MQAVGRRLSARLHISLTQLHDLARQNSGSHDNTTQVGFGMQVANTSNYPDVCPFPLSVVLCCTLYYARYYM